MKKTPSRFYVVAVALLAMASFFSFQETASASETAGFSIMQTNWSLAATDSKVLKPASAGKHKLTNDGPGSVHYTLVDKNTGATLASGTLARGSSAKLTLGANNELTVSTDGTKAEGTLTPA